MDEDEENSTSSSATLQEKRDKSFWKYQNRISRSPQQVLRYSHNSLNLNCA